MYLLSALFITKCKMKPPQRNGALKITLMSINDDTVPRGSPQSESVNPTSHCDLRVPSGISVSECIHT
jgi:hypothetical protein